jgi:hypothetical protein
VAAKRAFKADRKRIGFVLLRCDCIQDWSKKPIFRDTQR